MTVVEDYDLEFVNTWHQEFFCYLDFFLAFSLLAGFFSAVAPCCLISSLFLAASLGG
jgi:hypothetical protein